MVLAVPVPSHPVDMDVLDPYPPEPGSRHPDLSTELAKSSSPMD